MDGKRVLKAAEWCDANEICTGCPAYEDCLTSAPVRNILAVRDHVKAEVIGKVREWLRDGGSGSLMRLLDELEQEDQA